MASENLGQRIHFSDPMIRHSDTVSIIYPADILYKSIAGRYRLP